MGGRNPQPRPWLPKLPALPDASELYLSRAPRQYRYLRCDYFPGNSLRQTTRMVALFCSLWEKRRNLMDSRAPRSREKHRSSRKPSYFSGGSYMGLPPQTARSIGLPRGGDFSLTVEVHDQECDVGRRDAADPARLGKVSGPNSQELLAGLGPKMNDSVVAKTIGNSFLGQARLSIDLDLLPRNVSGVFLIDFDLLGHKRINGRQFREARHGVVPRRLRTPEQLRERRPIHKRSLERRGNSIDFRLFRLKPIPTFVIDQPAFKS